MIEWKNGDECAYNNMGYIFVGMTPTFNDVSCIIFSPVNGIEHVSVRALRKPETPQQKLERQRLESAYHLACIAGGVDKWGGEFTFDNFKEDKGAVNRWLAVVDETQYIKGR